MKCDNCGVELIRGDRFCPQCGNALISTNKSNSNRDNKPLREKYLRGGYDESETPYYDYEEEYWEEEYYAHEEPEPEYAEERNSGWASVFMLLILALVIGFVIGILIFSSGSQSIPPVRIGS